MADPQTDHAETATMVRHSDQLTTALRAVVNSSDIAGLGPIEAARVLGVDKTLVSRLMAALRAREPLAALNALPGTSPLRQFLRAARAHGARARALRAAETELRAFEQELQRAFGTRSRLGAVLADALPETRRRHQEGARQAVYRGMALIKGVSVDVASITWIVHPGRDDPERVDTLALAGYTGIRRLRPTACVRLMSRPTRPNPVSPDGALLREFCRPHDLSISTSHQGTDTVYEISTGPVRRDSAADVFLTEFSAQGASIRAPAVQGRAFVYSAGVAHSSRRLAMCILLHKDVWPGCGFALRSYDTAIRGWVAIPDPAREADALDVDAPVIRAPATAETLRLFPIPGYPDILARIAAPLGWDLAAFRLFRCEVVYPLYGAQFSLVYEPSS